MRIKKFKCRACHGRGRLQHARRICFCCGGKGHIVRETWETAERQEHMRKTEKLRTIYADTAPADMRKTAREARLRLLALRGIPVESGASGS